MSVCDRGRLIWLLVSGLSACASNPEVAKPSPGRPPVASPESFVLLRPMAHGPQITLPADIVAHNAGSLLEPIYELCLDFASAPKAPEPRGQTGAPATLTAVRPTPGLPGADAAIEAGLRAWQWSVVSSRPLTQLSVGLFCWQQRLRFAVPGVNEVVPGPVFSHRQVKGADPHLPAIVRLAHAGETLDASYRICLDHQSGQTKDIKPLVGIAGADAEIIELLQTWAWHVEVPPQYKDPVCWTQEFQFVVPGEKDDESLWVVGTAEAPPYHLAILPALLAADVKAPDPSPAASGAPPVRVKKQLVYGPLPHLPEGLKARYAGDQVIGAYKICIEPGGSVSTVEPILPVFGATQRITKTLSSWRFAPMPISICFLQVLQFQVERQQ